MFGDAIEILLVEDSPSDQLLAQSALAHAELRSTVHVVADGVEAMSYLRAEGRYHSAPRPDLILLDLNLPRKGGREVLREIKSSDELKRIPVVVLSTSEEDRDVEDAYALHANCYIAKPVDFDEFKQAILGVQAFWFKLVRLPARRARD
jgi:two-component system, chemotaxis family, response regulator Rcp1